MLWLKPMIASLYCPALKDGAIVYCINWPDSELYIVPRWRVILNRLIFAWRNFFVTA